jgi:hypothetical protein
LSCSYSCSSLLEYRRKNDYEHEQEHEQEEEKEGAIGTIDWSSRRSGFTQFARIGGRLARRPAEQPPVR